MSLILFLIKIVERGKFVWYIIEQKQQLKKKVFIGVMGKEQCEFERCKWRNGNYIPKGYREIVFSVPVPFRSTGEFKYFSA